MASATSNNVYQQSKDFIPNNHHHNRQTGDISTLTFPPQTPQQQQQQNFITINQFNIIDIHCQANGQTQQQIASPTPSSLPIMNNQTIRIKDEDRNDSYYHHHNYPQGPPSSSPGSSMSSDCDGRLMVDNRDYMSEIDHACKILAISADPYNWNQTDVRKWLMYQQRLHQLKSCTIIENGFRMDGMSLCELNLEDFHQRILSSLNMTNGNMETWNYATVLYQELNIWRNAITKMFEPDFTFFDSSSSTVEQSQNYDQFPVMNDNKSMMLVPYSRQAQSSSPTSEKSSSYCSSSSYGGQQMFSYGSHMDGYQNNVSQSLPMNSFYDPSSNNSVYSSSPSSSPQRSLYCSSPAGSISSASSMINNNYITNHMQQQQLPSSQQSVDHIALNQGKFPENSYTSMYQNVYGNDLSGHQEHMFYPQQLKSEYGSDDDMLSDDDPINGKCPMIISTQKCHQTPMSHQSATMKKPTFNGSRPHGSSTSIQLWQFLKELLSHPNQYENAIRWLERPRGVFKIEDSVRVARLWGQRKNRPAMNYDKLSRSIRQYYKKGIMKKTERAQRLVYQFCQPYAM